MASNLETSFVRPFLRVVSDVLLQIGGKPVGLRILDAPPEALERGIEIALRSDPRLRMRVGFDDAGSQYFAALLVGEAVADEVERQATVEELWRQIVGRATTELKPILHGGDLEVVTPNESGWTPERTFVAQLDVEGGSPLRLSLQLSREVIEYVAPIAPVDCPGVGGSSPIRHQNLDLLLDVPLSVTLRFGERRMPLRDILQLNSGTVVELDRRADEPVELYLDERVIARGNVVVVDGCYGLRVTEVCSSQPVPMQADLRL